MPQPPYGHAGKAGHKLFVHPVLKTMGVIAAAAVLCAIAIPAYIHLASEAVIVRRYPLPGTSGGAAPLPGMAVRGAHLARVAGCSDCHGATFEGRRLIVAGTLQVWSSNLRAAGMADDEFERALRRGIRPDAMSLWGMPALDYMYMSKSDVAALRVYLSGLGSAGRPRPGPVWNRRARLALLDGRVVPAVLETRDAPSSLDMGPRYDGGRYLARIACSECHGTDLEGMPAWRSPDLDVISLYNRPAFFDLMRRGIGVHGRPVPAMRRLAGIRFHVFADYEIMALYDYLEARAHAPAGLVARARANEARRKAQIAAESGN